MFNPGLPYIVRESEAMNTPTHLAVSACLSQAVVNYFSRYTHSELSRLAMPLCMLFCFFVGMGLHLFLDLTPHYAWIVYLGWFPEVPLNWMLSEALFSLPVVIPCFYWGRDHGLVMLLAMLGGMYPDVEKVARVEFHLPQEAILFWTHREPSTNDYGIAHPLLITLEVSIVLVALWITYRLAVARRQMIKIKPTVSSI